MSELVKSPAWTQLREHHASMQTVHMRALFADDPKRFERFSLRLDDLLVDYSKHRITGETMKLLLDFARERRVVEWRDDMFAGKRINGTEQRAVLHVALRNRKNRPILVDGQDVMPDVNATLAKMRAFADAVRSGAWKHAPGKELLHNSLERGSGGGAPGLGALPPQRRHLICALFATRAARERGGDAGRGTGASPPDPVRMNLQRRSRTCAGCAAGA